MVETDGRWASASAKVAVETNGRWGSTRGKANAGEGICEEEGDGEDRQEVGIHEREG